MTTVKMACRPSKLALAQAHLIKDALQSRFGDIEISVVTISTQGDRDTSAFLYQSQGQGLFTSEVERALIDHRADIAVHSLKDLPTAVAPELIVAAMPKRESAADALVAAAPGVGLRDLPKGATVGTSSLRRIAQLRHLRDDLNCVPLRGNVETRLSMVASGRIDAAVMACAGLNRLGLADRISSVLPIEEFLPAPAQGALAVQVRRKDPELVELISQLDDADTRLAVETERHILASMQGGCSIPLGVHAYVQGDVLVITAMISDLEGKTYIRRSRTASRAQAMTCATELAHEMLDAGGRQILQQIRGSRA